MIKSFKKLKLVLILFSIILFLGFCIITNSIGDYRYYIASDLPFVYRLHSSTPAEFFPVVWEAAGEWNKVEGSFFAFQQGQTTLNGNLGLNGENLVFFDLAGENFAPGTNVIAFSSTFTTSSGGFRAVESDYIYNARDFPPGLNGEPGRQDLHAISVHELGHHLGLDHTGLPSSASSGCGPLVQEAVMWAFSSGGDTTKRRLHIEDIMGLISVYPNWVIQGRVSNYSNVPISGAEIFFNGTTVSEIGPVINPISNRRNKAGLISNKLLTDENGEYKSVVKDRTFSIEVDGFGYYAQSQEVIFNTPSGFGNTQFLTFNFNLLPTPIADFSFSVTDTLYNLPIEASYEIFWMGKPDSALISSQTGSSGTFTESLPSEEYYRLILNFNHPYIPQKVFDSLLISETGLSMEFKTKPVSNLLVLDIENITYQEKIFSMLQETNYEFAIWDNIQPDSLLSTSHLNIFTAPLTLVWTTSSQGGSGLSAGERDLLKDHLRSGGRLILAGQNVSEFLQGDSLITNYFGVEFNSNYSGQPVRGFSNDFIGDGVAFNFAGGSKDQLHLSGNSLSNIIKAFHYGTGIEDTVRIAGVRFENSTFSYRGLFMGFGFEFIPFATGVEILTRALNYTNDTSNITSLTSEDIIKPSEYTLSQNYPNPFNPFTTISFSIPTRVKVELKIFNSLGEEVTTLTNKEFDAGNYQIKFNASSLASGIYFYRINAGSFSDTKKFVLLK